MEISSAPQHRIDLTTMIIICAGLAIIYKLSRDLRGALFFIGRGIWGGIKSIFVFISAEKTIGDPREKREELYIATAMVFLLIMGHLAYAAQGLSLIPLM